MEDKIDSLMPPAGLVLGPSVWPKSFAKFQTPQSMGASTKQQKAIAKIVSAKVISIACTRSQKHRKHLYPCLIISALVSDTVRKKTRESGGYLRNYSGSKAQAICYYTRTGIQEKPHGGRG